VVTSGRAAAKTTRPTVKHGTAGQVRLGIATDDPSVPSACRSTRSCRSWLLRATRSSAPQREAQNA
jgi:hypothetical protein